MVLFPPLESVCFVLSFLSGPETASVLQIRSRAGSVPAFILVPGNQPVSSVTSTAGFAGALKGTQGSSIIFLVCLELRKKCRSS